VGTRLEGAAVDTDDRIENDIRSALGRDPRIPSPEAVAVAAEGDFVTLRGTVGSFRQRRAAVSDARNVTGVSLVDDQLEVRLLDDPARTDAELRGTALERLFRDTDVDEESVEVKVQNGWLTLSGEVSYQFESDAVYEDIASVKGVLGVTNQIRVITP
jgi:osmotically-inducible protein OsmY